MFLGLCKETWQLIASVATASGALLAIIGLFLTWKAIRQNTITRQLQLFEGVFHDLLELDQRHIESFATLTPAQKTAWSGRFFNTVEYLCFMLNRKYISKNDLKGFFTSSGALSAWRSMFDQHVSGKILGDSPSAFSEFKKMTTGISG